MKLNINLGEGIIYRLEGGEIDINMTLKQFEVQRPGQIVRINKPLVPHQINFRAESVKSWEVIPDVIATPPDPQAEKIAALQAQLESLTAALAAKPEVTEPIPKTKKVKP